MIEQILQNKSTSKIEARTDLLPAFNANSGFAKESFRDLMSSIRENSFGINKKTYNHDNSALASKHVYKNNSMSYNNNNYNRSFNNQYNNDYNRNYRSNNDGNSFKENFSSKNDYESRYATSEYSSYNEYNNDPYIDNSVDLGVKDIDNEEVYTRELKDKIENLTQNDGTVSLNDLIDLLKTLQMGEQISSEGEINDPLSEIKSMLSSLNISSEQKDSLDEILSKLQMMSNEDLQAMSKIISLIHENMLEEKVGAQTGVENVTLDNISNKLVGDDEEIQDFNKLVAQIKDIAKSLNLLDGVDNKDLLNKVTNSENLEEIKSIVNLSDPELLTKISEATSLEDLEGIIGKDNLNKLQNLLGKDSVGKDLLVKGLASKDLTGKDLINNKEIVGDIKNLEDIIPTDSENSNEILSLVGKNELSDLNKFISSINNSEISENVQQTLNDIVSLIDSVANNQLNVDGLGDVAELADAANINLKDTSLKDVVATLKAMAEKILNSQSSNQLNGQVANNQVANNQGANAQQNLNLNNVGTENSILDNELSLRQEAEKSVKESAVSNPEKIVKESVKQVDALTTKDLMKEFKGVNVEATETVRGEAKAQMEAKVAENIKTVTLNDGAKISFNSSLNKENVNFQNVKFGENTSQDKGNNFNFFLKSSSEAQAKIDQAVTKEAAQTYNLREPRDIEKLMRNIQSSVSKGESKLSVVLTPENLGKLHIQLTETGGKVTAKFIADNETSHKLIMSQGDLLKNQLSEKGIVIDNMEFAFNDAMSNKGDQHSENSKKAGKNFNKNKDNRDNDIEVTETKTQKQENGVYA